MRNLKRALSLALASVMLLGMMVVGTSAAFADADEIVNTEAVEITAGLGLFAGSDGKFNPKGNVTRAQMATVIVKMLYGSEINADQYKGIAKFNDVAAFEGGWAEGYVNLCANLGIVGGYGDGSFKPGNSVTTAEAVTMIINALGVDAGKGTWPLTVMAKAEEMKLFEELAVKPATNVALTRDQLASVVLEGLKYSPAGNNGYSVTVGNKTFTFDKIADALAAAGNDLSKIDEVVGEDTLAKTVFEMTSVTGFVTANQATGEDYTVVDGVALALESGLDMIGHYVTAYYAEAYESEDEPGKAYCIVDEAKYVTVDEPQVDTKKEYQKFFGTKAVDVAASTVITNGNYYVYGAPYVNDNGTDNDESDDFVVTLGDIAGYDKATWTAGKGTYAIYEGEIIAYMAPAASYATKVQKVTTTAGKESITLATGGQLSNSEDDDVVNEYEGIAKNDIVIVSVAQGTIYTLTKATSVEGQVTKTAVDEFGNNTITVNGTVYTEYAPGVGSSGANRNAIDFDKTYEIFTIGDKYIGWKAATSEANVSDVIYVLGGYDVTTTDAYGNDVTNVYAHGVDMTGKEVSILVGIDYDAAGSEDLGETVKANVASGYATFKLSTDKDEKKANIMEATALNTIQTPDYQDGIFSSTVAQGTEMKSDDGKIITNDGLAYIAETTKIILIEGGLGETLETAVMTGSIKKTLNGAADVILTEDDYGSKTMEVMVIVDVVGLQAEDYIFVSDVDAAAAATVGTGLIEVDAWFTKSGEKKTITVNANSIAGDKFFEYTYDTVEEYYDLTDADVTTDANQDGFVDSGLFMNETFDSANIGKKLLVSTNIAAWDASEAKIIDTRSEKELEEADVAEITSLEDMADAKLAEYDVAFVAIVDLEDEIVENVFVISVAEAQ